MSRRKKNGDTKTTVIRGTLPAVNCKQVQDAEAIDWFKVQVEKIHGSIEVAGAPTSWRVVSDNIVIKDPMVATKMPADIDAVVVVNPEDGTTMTIRPPAIVMQARHASRAKLSQRTQRAEVALGWVEVVLPRRVAKEEIGDALELITVWRDEGRGHLKLRIGLKVVTTILWCLWNAVRFALPSLAGKKAE